MLFDFGKKPFVVGATSLQNGQQLRMRCVTVAPALSQNPTGPASTQHSKRGVLAG
jgi:hypothetical protein